MKGQLYIVGIGPGASDLLTLRAVRTLEQSPVVCVPKGRSEGSSVARLIIEGAVSLAGKEVLEFHFPMRKIRMAEDAHHEVEEAWNRAADAVRERIDKGLDVAFPTLGDPSFFSTAYHLVNVLTSRMSEFRIHVIPGVSSISAAAADSGMPLGLGDDRIVILPATYEAEGLRQALQTYDTVVLMKIHKALDRILDTLEELQLLHQAVVVERASMDDERITSASSLRGTELHYFSTMIVRRR